MAKLKTVDFKSTALIDYNAIFDTGCVGLQKVAFFSLGCICYAAPLLLQPVCIYLAFVF